jgi:hypothetical protein
MDLIDIKSFPLRDFWFIVLQAFQNVAQGSRFSRYGKPLN